MARRWQSNRNDSGSLLAAVFILTLGAGGCLFTVAAMSPNSVPMAAAILGGIVGAFMLLVILQRFGKTPKMDLGFLLKSRRNRRDDGLGDYVPRVAGQPTNGAAGTNRPITAQEAHEIQITSQNTWVPAAGRRTRKS